MGGQQYGSRPVGQRERARGGRDRHYQERALWVQSSSGPLGAHNGRMWSARGHGVQRQQAGPRVGRAQKGNAERLTAHRALGLEPDGTSAAYANDTDGKSLRTRWPRGPSNTERTGVRITRQAVANPGITYEKANTLNIIKLYGY